MAKTTWYADLSISGYSDKEMRGRTPILLRSIVTHLIALIVLLILLPACTDTSGNNSPTATLPVTSSQSDASSDQVIIAPVVATLPEVSSPEADVIPITNTTPLPNFAFGGHLNDPANVSVASSAGMGWIKTFIRFSIGDDPAAVALTLSKFRLDGYQLIVTVVGDREDLAAAGAAYYQIYAAFVGGLASSVDAIAIWDEPNLNRTWPTGAIDAAAYTELLAAAYQAIKQADPETLVISGALAPNGAFSNAGGCTNEGCNDDVYLRNMYQAGAKEYMDCLGVEYLVGATSPIARSGHPRDSGTGHYSWYFEPMLELYWNSFNPPEDVEKGDLLPLCFTEVGYLSYERHETMQRIIASNFWWASGITEQDQAQWLSEALTMSRCSGQVQMFIVWNLDFVTLSANDPQMAYAILRPDASCPACAALLSSLTQSCSG